jgi:hypothetical protein
MSFSASTCVTNLGGVSSASTVQILTYPGNVPIGGNIILSAMTGSNCPYTITGIPDGTTMLKIFVPSTNACGYIDISDNDLCNTCDLGFDSFTSSTIGNIVVGNLTGSCDNPITDYIINWYGPSENASPRSTNVARISGKGSAFPDYNYPHPLTGTSALPMERGYYVPVIDKVRINGVDFSITGGTGYVPANLDCFDGVPVYVSGYTCENGTEEGDYSHRVRFITAGGSKPPQALSSSFILSATTNFFAWKFKGETIPDQLKLTFRGAAYDFEPIILEWWEVGQPLYYGDNQQDIDVFPKSAQTPEYIYKVTTLTGMTITDDDTIKLEVIPSKTNPATSWDFYFTCLESFNCDTCLDSYENQTYKIIGSSITGITGSCNTINIQMRYDGCDNSNVYTSDLWKYYYVGGNYGLFYMSYDVYGSRLLEDSYYRDRTVCGVATSGGIGTCSNSGNYISFTKSNSAGPGSPGVIQMYFSGGTAVNDFNKFYDRYLFYKNSSFYSGSTDNTDYDYYTFMVIYISSATGSTLCGDGTSSYSYYFHHPTAVVTTGLTMGVYSLNITMPTMTKGLFPPSCDEYCELNIDYVVDSYVNLDSTGTTNNRTLITNQGAAFDYPILVNYILKTTGSDVNTEYDRSWNLNINSLNTIPVSGNTNTLIPSLSGQVCDYSSKGYFNTNNQPSINGFHTYSKKFLRYKVELTNLLDVRDFDIYASPISNFVYSGYPGTPYYELAYSYSGGSVVYSNPTYII